MEQRNVSCRPKERQLYTRKNTEMKKKNQLRPKERHLAHSLCNVRLLASTECPSQGGAMEIDLCNDCLHQQSGEPGRG